MTDYRWIRLLAYVTGLVNQKLLLRIPAKWMDDSDAMWIKSERSDANI